jgi:uncharacterized protein YjaG (DUF416 family)
MEMNLKYDQLDIVEKKLEALSPPHRIAFAVACCERLFPNYGVFLQEIREQGWNDQDPMRNALDEIWGFLSGKEVNVAKFNQLLSHCEEFPYGYENEETAESQRAIWSIVNTLELCLEPTSKNAISIVRHVHETLFEYLDCEMCQSDKDWSNKSHSEIKEIIANHPFTVKEMAKQSEDLQNLKKTPTLSPEFLRRLRTSSENGGKSLIDLP